MKKNLFFLMLLISWLPALCDPGIGLVSDSRGNIFYTDLSQVWKIAPNGSKSIAVPQVHTHQLYMDGQDNLYGEHLWYEGTTTDVWRSYYWRLSSNGRLDTVAGPVEGFEADLSLYRDSLGNQYRMVRWKGLTRIKKIRPDSTVVTLAEKQLRGAGWMLVTPGGSIYMVDVDDIYRIDGNGNWNLVAKGITGSKKAERLDVLGIWLDKNGAVYAADAANRQVKKIDTNGRITVIFTSTGGYHPSAGLWDTAGNLWVLEYNDKNEVRVTTRPAARIRHAAKNTGTGRNAGKHLLNTAVPLLLLLTTAGYLFFLKYYKARK